MLIKEVLNKYIENKKKITDIYIDQHKLEKEIIQYFIDNKELFTEIELDEHIISLQWVFDKYIDYELLEKKYPEIYLLGLTPTFSKTHLMKVISKEDSNLILRECTLNSSEYKLKLKRKKKEYKEKRKEKQANVS